MLINPNISINKYYLTDNYINNHQEAVSFEIKDNAIFGQLKEGFYEGLLHMNFNNVEEAQEVTLQAYVENRGDIPFTIQQQGIDYPLKIKTLNPGESYFVNINGTNDGSHIAHQFRFKILEQGKLGIYCKGFKIEQGTQATQYVPHIDNVKNVEFKRLFSGGGIAFKEIYPL